jgi:hypothetical protein
LKKPGESTKDVYERALRPKDRSDMQLGYLLSNEGTEVRAFLSELYDHIAISKKVPLDRPFAVTEKDVVDALESLPKSPISGNFPSSLSIFQNFRHNPKKVARYLSNAAIGGAGIIASNSGNSNK